MMQLILTTLLLMALLNTAYSAVELISFSANQVGDSIRIKWQTASEANSDYFAVERSTDAENFIEIAKIDGAGNSEKTKSYSYIDSTIEKGGIYFYRLNQADFDGEEAFSNIVTIDVVSSISEADLPQFSFRSYPNPVQDKLNIEPGENSIVNSLEIYDVLGRRINTYQPYERELDISNLPSGIYLLKIETEAGVISKKVVVER